MPDELNYDPDVSQLKEEIKGLQEAFIETHKSNEAVQAINKSVEKTYVSSLYHVLYLTRTVQATNKSAQKIDGEWKQTCWGCWGSDQDPDYVSMHERLCLRKVSAAPVTLDNVPAASRMCMGGHVHDLRRCKLKTKLHTLAFLLHQRRDKQALKARIKGLEEEKERLVEKVERAKAQNSCDKGLLAFIASPWQV
eukprot:42695-Pelagomonas_calceolata.AAC.8